ncbi:putative MarR family transcriptional regulator [Metapseudomonas resinovorans NBRC 106553]|uniref:Putative MarR family transcriptional regulator n=2 Tax=Metapseudomonas resinovorans TaxID=53412 RepID=S6BHL6_METRE|nr:putative MarR family transcriptional regulator [Pseudomonas resinovorans NBRC 106553]
MRVDAMEIISAPKPGASKKSKTSSKTESKILKDVNWEQRLGFLMHDVSRLRRTVFDEFMKPLGVTRSQWWVLACVSRHDGMTQSDVANMLEIGKAALGSLIDRLEESELVVRGSDAVDRRVKRIYLSDKGKQLIRTMTAESNEMSERILEGLSQTERQQFVDLLSRVKQNLLHIKREMPALANDASDID